MLESAFLNLQTVLIGAVLGLLAYYILRRSKYRLPPSPPCWPIIGHYKIYTSKDMHRKVFEVSKKYGPVITIKTGPIPLVILNSIDTVVEALIKKKADFAGRPKLNSMETFTDCGSDIAFGQYTPRWKLHRKIAGRALRHYLQGDLLESLIEDNLTKFLDKMANEKEPFTIKEYIDKMVFHQLYTLCFGEKKAIDDEELNTLLKLDDDLTEMFGNGFLEDIIPFMKDVFTTKRFKDVQRKSKEMLAFIAKKFQEHKDTFDPHINRDFTDSLLMARREAEKEEDAETMTLMNDTHLIQTISDIFFAGVDTTRMTLDWFMCFMSGLPEIQEKCREEIDRNIGTRLPSMKDRGNLDFTESCLYETMRLGTVVSLGVPHKTICDTQVGGYDVPKDTTVLINHWALHHDPRYWKGVEKFDPTRYLDENGKLDTKPESWLPFSAGRRVCLGEPLAKPEILLMIVHFLQRFEIRLPYGVQPDFGCKMPTTGLELAKDYKVVLIERN